MVHGHPTLSEARHGGRARRRWLAHPRLTPVAPGRLLLRPGQPRGLPRRRARQLQRSPRSPSGSRSLAARAAGAPRASTRGAAEDDELALPRHIERRAAAAGLQPRALARPVPVRQRRSRCSSPTYAKPIGRTVRVRAGRVPPGLRRRARRSHEPDNVLIAAAACEMHPAAVLKGAQLRSVRDGAATRRPRGGRARRARRAGGVAARRPRPPRRRADRGARAPA